MDPETNPGTAPREALYKTLLSKAGEVLPITKFQTRMAALMIIAAGVVIGGALLTGKVLQKENDYMITGQNPRIVDNRGISVRSPITELNVLSCEDQEALVWTNDRPNEITINNRDFFGNTEEVVAAQPAIQFMSPQLDSLGNIYYLDNLNGLLRVGEDKTTTKIYELPALSSDWKISGDGKQLAYQELGEFGVAIKIADLESGKITHIIEENSKPITWSQESDALVVSLWEQSTGISLTGIKPLPGGTYERFSLGYTPTGWVTSIPGHFAYFEAAQAGTFMQQLNLVNISDPAQIIRTGITGEMSDLKHDSDNNLYWNVARGKETLLYRYKPFEDKQPEVVASGNATAFNHFVVCENN